MGHHDSRKAATIAAAVVGLTICIGAPAFAQGSNDLGSSAPEDNGQRTGPVQFWAEDLGGCKAKFNIDNQTNATTYTIDWRIDLENGRFIPDIGIPIYRTGEPNMTSKAASPTWPDQVPPNTPENRTLVSDRPTFHAEYIQDLKALNGSWNPPLPNPDADTHRVDYRIQLGPPQNNGQTPSGTPEWIGERNWHTITVTGCNPPTGSGGSNGSGGGS